jgi:eukaryotic-like serine/threonine-protein kinase
LTGTDAQLERRVLDLFQVLLDLPPGERMAWVEAHSDVNSPLRNRLIAMLAGDKLANMRTGGAGDMIVDERLPERIGAYRITSLIGQGGMGAVYRGERAVGDFDHVAAIKVVRPGALSNALVERFQRERQTLASLSHPNIARLFDGGATDKGDPYIVMEYVDGMPLGTWIETAGASKAERTQLFLDICSAVGFAHQNLIVHRDITPSNVLVANDGTAKLIDFGIARPPVADTEAPASVKKSLAGLSLTPGYAAPERIAGEAATTLSDVYSLGILLDRLLKDEADPDVIAVIGQASATDPADRYPSVDALADDVKAWRDGKVVAARRGGKRYALRKFVARHRIGAGASALAVLLLIGALVTTLVANQSAEMARVSAEKRFAQTRSIAKTMLFDVYDEVSKAPGGTTARELLARTGLTYLDALATDKSAPIDVRTEVAIGYVRLSQVVGGGQSGQLGKLADANDLVAKAENMLASIPVNQRGSMLVARAFGEVLIQQSGNDLYTNNQIKRARVKAIEAQRVILPYARQDEDSARLYATAVQAEGDSHGWDDNFDAARSIHQRAEAFIVSLPPKLRHSSGVTKARSANMRLLAEAMHRLKDDAGAIRAVDRAVALNEALLKAVPDDPSILRKVAASLWYRAVLLRESKRDGEASASINRAVALARMMEARDPNDKGALNLFALTAEVQAQTLADWGRFSESYAISDDVIDAHRRLVALAGNAPGARVSMAAAIDTRGGSFYNGGAYVRACDSWAESLAIYRSLDKRGALSDFYRKNSLNAIAARIAITCNPPRKGLVGQLRL